MLDANPWQVLLDQAGNALTAAFKRLEVNADEHVLRRFSEPPSPEMGDVSSSACLSIAKKLGKNPLEVASQAVEALDLEGSFFSKAETAGPGYVNFFIDYARLGELVKLIPLSAEDYGAFSLMQGKKAVIEFPSVNPGKPLHVGHLRNAVLGESVARLLQALGCKVVRMDYIDDLGLQVAKLLWGYQNTAKEPDPRSKLDHWQGLLYVEVEKRAASDAKIEEGVRELLKHLESPESRTFLDSREIVMDGVRSQHQTTQRLGIFHDVLVFESDVLHSGLFKDAFELLSKNKDVVVEREGKNKGCAVVKLSHLPEFKGMDNPDKIIVRSDGTTTYTGKDIAFHLWKLNLVRDPFYYSRHYQQDNSEFVWRSTLDKRGSSEDAPQFNGADVIVNVIGSEQSYPQKVVKYSLKLLGFEEQCNNFTHLAYGLVDLPDGAISGRTGNWVGYSADVILDTSVDKVTAIMKERNPDLFDERGEELSEKIGVGAVKFALLKVDPVRNITFKWDEVLDFEGQTAPYAQYAFARCSRILERAPEYLEPPDFGLCVTPSEKHLVKALTKSPSVVLEAAQRFQPFKVCEYLVELTSRLNAFYRDCPVLTASPKALLSARLSLVSSTKTVLENGLDVLGIDAPDKM